MNQKKQDNLFSVLDVDVNAISSSDVINLICEAIDKKEKCKTFFFINFHGALLAAKDKKISDMYKSSYLVLPDGLPLMLLAKKKGFKQAQRVSGPDIFNKLLSQTRSKYTHYLYGGDVGISKKLANILETKFNATIVGEDTPPYKEISDSELKEIAKKINFTNPDIVWIGIPCPKQEILSLRLQPLLNCSAILPVGAAFDFLSGNKPRAPRWMQKAGLEWFFRLMTEPKRLWKRYLFGIPQFLWKLIFSKNK
jgi:N-acetylglucosaminyldiphosphoundecaprenol N-acetyl-beta-D-mannosaminyltransferase